MGIKSTKAQALHTRKAPVDDVRPQRSMPLKIFMVSYFTLRLSEWTPMLGSTPILHSGVCDWL